VERSGRARRRRILSGSGGRDPAVVAFEIEVVSFFFDAADLLGVPKSVAAIYGLCFASVEPLSLTDINDRLDISIGSISQGLRVLREVGALKVVVPPAELTPESVSRGARTREHFAPDLELRKLAARFIEQRLEKQLKAGKGRLQTMKSALPSARPASDLKELKARLRQLDTWHNKGMALVPLIKTFLRIV
jgi:DNA-binding transcriptional regulator GbsR (MarR family)